MIEVLKRPIESDYTSYVAYTRALEQYCNSLESQEPVAWMFQHGETNRMIEVLKQMYQLLLTEPHTPAVCDQLEVILRQAIAELESQEPVIKLQEPTVERAWFTIAELNAWADKKLSENPHWVMPKDEPERNELPPQRTWVGLTKEDKDLVEDLCEMMIGDAAFSTIDAILKGKNT